MTDSHSRGARRRRDDLPRAAPSRGGKGLRGPDKQQAKLRAEDSGESAPSSPRSPGRSARAAIETGIDRKEGDALPEGLQRRRKGPYGREHGRAAPIGGRVHKLRSP